MFLWFLTFIRIYKETYNLIISISGFLLLEIMVRKKKHEWIKKFSSQVNPVIFQVEIYDQPSAGPVQIIVVPVLGVCTAPALGQYWIVMLGCTACFGTGIGTGLLLFCWFLIIVNPKKIFWSKFGRFFCILRVWTVSNSWNFELYFCLDVKMNLSL